MSFVILGFHNCGYFNQAVALLKRSKLPHSATAVQKHEWKDTLDHLRRILKEKKNEGFKTGDLIKKVDNHHTSPLVFFNNVYLGGYTDMAAYLSKSK